MNPSNTCTNDSRYSDVELGLQCYTENRNSVEQTDFYLQCKHQMGLTKILGTYGALYPAEMCALGRKMVIRIV